MVVNADKTVDGFHGKMIFSETFIPYKNDTSWIPKKVKEMISTMNSNTVPDPHKSCENCANARVRSEYD